jgi:hypothetical protein
MGRGRGSGGRRGSGPVAGSGRGAGRGSGQGAGRKGGPSGRALGANPAAAGPGGYCVCPNCGERKEHVAGVPCYQAKCPKCGTLMVREQ